MRTWLTTLGTVDTGVLHGALAASSPLTSRTWSAAPAGTNARSSGPNPLSTARCRLSRTTKWWWASAISACWPSDAVGRASATSCAPAPTARTWHSWTFWRRTSAPGSIGSSSHRETGLSRPQPGRWQAQGWKPRSWHDQARWPGLFEPWPPTCCMSRRPRPRSRLPLPSPAGTAGRKSPSPSTLRIGMRHPAPAPHLRAPKRGGATADRGGALTGAADMRLLIVGADRRRHDAMGGSLHRRPTHRSEATSLTNEEEAHGVTRDVRRKRSSSWYEECLSRDHRRRSGLRDRSSANTCAGVVPDVVRRD